MNEQEINDQEMGEFKKVFRLDINKRPKEHNVRNVVKVVGAATYHLITAAHHKEEHESDMNSAITEIAGLLEKLTKRSPCPSTVIVAAFVALEMLVHAVKDAAVAVDKKERGNKGGFGGTTSFDNFSKN